MSQVVRGAYKKKSSRRATSPKRKEGMETFSVREIATIVHAALQEAGGEVESARPKAVALVNRWVLVGGGVVATSSKLGTDPTAGSLS